MSTKKIKRVLKAKAIPYELIDIDHATCCAETEWSIIFFVVIKKKIIELSDGEITQDDFQFGFGGNKEHLDELLEMLPHFDKDDGAKS